MSKLSEMKNAVATDSRKTLSERFVALSKGKKIAVVACAALLVFCLGSVAAGGSGNAAEPGSGTQPTRLADTGGANDQDAPAAVSDGVLSFVVESTAQNAASEYVVSVEGEKDAGDKVSEKFNAKVGQPYSLEGYEPGTYEFSIAIDPKYDGVAVLKCDGATARFDKSENVEAKLKVEVDVQATEKAQADAKAQEEQAKAEADAKAKAEAQAKAEEEARAQAAAEEAARAEAAAASSSNSDSQTVYVPKSGKGKYHSKPGCSGMKDPGSMSLDDARNAGYEPCKKCC